MSGINDLSLRDKKVVLKAIGLVASAHIDLRHLAEAVEDARKATSSEHSTSKADGANDEAVKVVVTVKTESAGDKTPMRKAGTAASARVRKAFDVVIKQEDKRRV